MTFIQEFKNSNVDQRISMSFLYILTVFGLYSIAIFLLPHMKELSMLVISGLIVTSIGLIVWLFNVRKGENVVFFGYCLLIAKPVYIVLDVFKEPVVQFFYALF